MLRNCQNVLVALDGSDQSEKAFQEALVICRMNKAKLYVLSVINNAELSTSAYAFAKIFDQEKLRVETDMLKKIYDANQHGVEDVEVIVEVGDPKRFIIHAATELYPIDLIIIGATGKGTLTRAVVGSTTDYVVNHSKCTVLVVK
ncbi:universal stress protein [Enterococcus casseliflavus]|uniref:universal stress protein n=1 Tax=Enterococcus casseliflavus TaxID=37734 RepID=UPI001432C2F3|nr:universal stress protein [Enterococcus casseliflavus]NKD37208.1 universal stress protein [Enterococcus casseliflavus]